MNKTQLTAEVARRAEISKAQAAKMVDTVLGVIADNLTAEEGDGEVALPDFGRFFVKSVPERQAFNPITREPIKVDAHEKVVFKPSGNLDIFSRKHAG